ncbi:uncharacterized protein LOC125943306 [Dermacentor silvarum]|uniref:uncharacterized protein LOC125943306 n=1 Tax=Dermacentor silvarum TaxID=543639 RepID=UPI002100EDC9|nr:uncharacterized protein LOC125943306 [Dermacentor silvarum]
MLRGRALRRCGRRGLRMALQRGTDGGPSSHELALLELVRWHPGALSKPGEPRLVLVVALRWISHCQDDPPLVEAALEALGSLLLRHRAGLRECCFELLMSVFHLLASPAASVRHKALGLTLILLEVDPVCASRELLYLAATGDRLQRLATMVAFRRLLCRGPGQPFDVWLLPMQALYELYLEHAEQTADDVLRTEGCLGLELLEHTCEYVDYVEGSASPDELYARRTVASAGPFSDASCCSASREDVV